MTELTPINIKTILGRSREILRTEGLRSLWFKILGETIYRRMDIFERKINPALTSIKLPDGLEVSPLKAGEVDELVKFRDLHNREAVLRRLEQGDVCFMVRAHGEIIHSAWVAKGRARIDYLARDIRLANNVVFIFEAYTAEAWRGKSISSMRKTVMEKYCHDQGYNLLLAVVWPENSPAYRNIEKAGYERIGRVGYFGVGRFRKYFMRNGRNGPSFQFTEKPEPTPPAYGNRYWDAVPGCLDTQSHYLDPFLAQMKRRENLRLVHEWGKMTKDSRLLKTDAFEEAMGEDTFLIDLCDLAGEITAIDISPAILQRAHSRHAEMTLNFLAADVRRLPFCDSSFSTVVSPSTLDHFSDPADLGVSLKELFRVMKPGGRLVITLDNRQNLFDPLLKLVHKLGLVPYYLGRSYTVGELRNELISTGFEVTETTAILHNPRLVAVATIRITRWLGWRWLTRSVHKLLLAAQKLEKTRLCYYTGSFVAALAIRPELTDKTEAPT